LKARKPPSNTPIPLFVLLFSVYLLTFSGRYHSSDEMAMLVTTDSLARRGAWDIELLRWMGEQQGSYGPDGHLYSRKGLGMTLAALPLYWLALRSEQVGNVQAAMLTNGLVTALTGALLYLALRRFRYSHGVSLGGALAYGLGTMAWPYARYLFSESLAALGLMLSFYFLLRFRDLDDRLSPLLAGTGLGLALLARLNNAMVIPFLGLLLLVYLRRHHRGEWRSWAGSLLLFGLPLLAALVITGWYNRFRFGNPLTTGYLAEERFATPFFEGFYGLTFSPGKGLFWYNPLLLAALAAWPAFYRRHRAEGLLAAAVVLGHIAFYAPWYLWWAGHSWGPRFLVTALPFAVLPLAPALEVAARRRAVAVGVGAVALLSIMVQILGVVVNFNAYLEEIYARLGLYHPATLFNPAYSPLLRQWSYLHPQSLDLAWVRAIGAAGDRQQGVGVAATVAFLGLVALLSVWALWAAWRGRLPARLAGGLLLLAGIGSATSLRGYAPGGDVAQAADLLARMERPGEAVALTDPLLTEAWQDAYDGALAVWGVPARREIGVEQQATWTVGSGDLESATARFQVGAVRLDYYSPPDRPFDVARLPALSPERRRVGEVAELLALQVEKTTVHPGGALPLFLGWRALAPTATSYTLFVQVIDQAGVKAGQVDFLPCDGGCPTNTWRPGDLVGEWLQVPVYPDAPPGRYRLLIGMYDLSTGERLPWFDAHSNPAGDALVPCLVEVTPGPPPRHPGKSPSSP